MVALLKAIFVVATLSDCSIRGDLRILRQLGRAPASRNPNLIAPYVETRREGRLDRSSRGRNPI